MLGHMLHFFKKICTAMAWYQNWLRRLAYVLFKVGKSGFVMMNHSNWPFYHELFWE
uniref:Uncharacterized protein n=1 Tax=Arundo donax TaxID=35708 RepID=A0A0A9C6A9_ARUDO